MTKVRGELDGTEITASFDGSGKKLFIGKLKETKALVLLSIRGNPYCTGEFLPAIVDHAVANHRKATFLVADEVYWNNLKDKKDELPERIVQLKQEALKLGSQFIEDNLAAFLKPLELTVKDFKEKYPKLATIDEQVAQINQLAVDKCLNFELVRWQTWVAHDTYRAVEHRLKPYYDSEAVLKKSIETTAANFSRRHHQDGGEALWLERSRSYLREESPAVMWLAAKQGYQFIAYCGDIIEPFKATRTFFIHKENTNMLPDDLAIVTQEPLVNWLDINFRRSYSKEQQIEKRSQMAMKKLSFFTDNQPKPQINSCHIDLENYTIQLATEVFANPEMDPRLKVDVLIKALTQLRQSIILDNCNVPSHALCHRASS